jgi:hypothetical protein
MLNRGKLFGMKRLIMPLLIITWSAAASGAETTSVYSDLELGKCQQLRQGTGEEEGNEWQCKGIHGFDVMVWEGDLRTYIAFGPEARSQCVSAQTFGHFNSPGARIEWRLENGKPYATILRWRTDNGEQDGKQNWLVVTKLNGKDACHTAYVDTKLPEANLIARQRADKKARKFKCEKDIPDVVSHRKIPATEIVSGAPCPGGPYREE